MKSKIKLEKKKIILMSSILLVLLFTCVFWFLLKEYIYFTIYLILTIFIGYIYFFTFYILKEKYLLIILGFIPIKIKYKNIKSIEKLNIGIRLKLKYFNLILYPNKEDMFYLKLQEEMEN